MTCYAYETGVSYGIGHSPADADLTVVGDQPDAWSVSDDDTSYVRMRAVEDSSILRTFLRRNDDVTFADLSALTLVWRAKAESVSASPVISVGFGVSFLAEFTEFQTPVPASWTSFEATDTWGTSFKSSWWSQYTSVAVGDTTPCYLFAQITSDAPPSDWVRLTYLAWRREVECGTPPLRQNQRDDIRQGQRTSRQLTARQVGYL